MDKEELYGEDRLAAETRIRNLLWTVSGDYDLSCELDIDSFQKAKEISLYDAIKQGPLPVSLIRRHLVFTW